MKDYSWSELTRRANTVKAQYPEGTRIVLLQMGDDPNPIPPNTRGTVDFVDDIGTVFVNFDNGRNLGMALEDSYRKLTEQELKEEALMNKEAEDIDISDNI